MSDPTIEPVPAHDRMRIATLGDFQGEHTRSWVRWFVDRGHEVHGISFYPVANAPAGVTMHALRSRASSTPASSNAKAGSVKDRVPQGLQRLAHGIRYLRAGLRGVLRDIAPDVFHGHFIVEHGFYGALARFSPYVVTAWGSDVLVAPERDPVSKRIARWTMRRADAATSNNVYMGRRMIALGAPRKRLHLVVLGADAFYGDRWEHSVNVRGREGGGPIVLSTRAHERLYNIGDIIDAFVFVQRDLPPAKLIIAHTGSLTDDLRAKARKLVEPAHFPGTVPRERLRELMTDAEVFVSVPSSDGTSVALLQAMAAGAFPIVADLPTQHEWIQDGINGRLVPLHHTRAIADAITGALEDANLRLRAAAMNRDLVIARGTNETQMLKMEAIYRGLARQSH